MPIATNSRFTTFPSYFSNNNKSQPTASPATNTPRTMAGNGSPTPYIKDEPEELQYNSNQFMSNSNYGVPRQQFSGQMSSGQGDFSSINPSDLTVSGSFNNQFGSQNMSSSFIMGNAGLGDDELLDSFFDNSNGQQEFNGHDQGNMQSQQGYFRDGQAVPMPQGDQMNQIYSNTPDGAPIQSPFVHGFDYSQFQRMPSHRGGFANSVPTTGSMVNGSMGIDMRARPNIASMDRHGSDSRSPMTPKTQALAGLQLGTPDSSSFPSQPIMANQINHRHQKSVSGQWDNTPGSAHSWVDSPMPSPHGGSLHHHQISEVLTSGKHASVPTKLDTGAQNSAVPAFQSQEAKRRRRRESHNLVERRRRDNINERIHDLSRLVPQHRLEDEKVRKHIHNNGPLSPSITATGMSPPQATSLLAGGNGRRAAGNITQGLPIEEKDKGPNKGDILNGAVGWTRDLMWMLHAKLEQEQSLRSYIEQLGGTWPFEETEDEKRMRTEIQDAVQKNGPGNFHYTRGPGSGLRVPKHTNVAGEPLENPISPQSLSPANQSGGSGADTGGSGQPQFWMNQQSSNGQGSFSLKEEDDYGMDMG